MNVSLTPELEKLVDNKVKSGLYQTASEVIREGLRLLKARDDRSGDLRASVRAGLEQIENGAYLEYGGATTKDLAEDIKRSGRSRLKKKTTGKNARK